MFCRAVYPALACALVALPLLASCVAPRRVEPVAPPVVRPSPAPAPVPVAPEADWSVADLPAGDWRYGSGGMPAGTVARFATAGGPALATLRCIRGTLTITREGVAAAPALTVRTSFAERRLPVLAAAAAAGGSPAASLPASDPLWDQIIYSRGRFVIETAGAPRLILPTRAELNRVVEDCRG